MFIIRIADLLAYGAIILLIATLIFISFGIGIAVGKDSVKPKIETKTITLQAPTPECPILDCTSCVIQHIRATNELQRQEQIMSNALNTDWVR